MNAAERFRRSYFGRRRHSKKNPVPRAYLPTMRFFLRGGRSVVITEPETMSAFERMAFARWLEAAANLQRAYAEYTESP